jgi:hypothetical protein
MSIIDSAKDVYELVKSDATPELQQKLMELREQALVLQEENLALRMRIQELEHKATRREEIFFEGDGYWRKKTNGHAEGHAENGKDGPFCQKCYDIQGKLVRLQSATHMVACRDWLCVVCKTGYGRFH